MNSLKVVIRKDYTVYQVMENFIIRSWIKVDWMDHFSNKKSLTSVLIPWLVTPRFRKN